MYIGNNWEFVSLNMFLHLNTQQFMGASAPLIQAEEEYLLAQVAPHCYSHFRTLILLKDCTVLTSSISGLFKHVFASCKYPT